MCRLAYDTVLYGKAARIPEHMTEVIHVPVERLRERVNAALRAGGADDPSADSTTRALMHASCLGIDSHGARLTPHYVKMMQSGRVNPRPKFRVERQGSGTAILDADNGLGHGAAYAGMSLACEIAQKAGAGAVGIVASSHFGAAGAYALSGAEAGFVAFVTTNSDSGVALHGSATPFHGTNPFAVAAPVRGHKPWLLDLATSSIPFNRVALFRSLNRPLPEGVAADRSGSPTTDPAVADMLLPLGGVDFGYKGAGLAGLATVLSAVLTGTTLDQEMIPMYRTDDFRTPRNIGHFCLALNAEQFAGRAAFDEAMTRYLSALRAVPARPGQKVMAPGDREWATETERRRSGIPVDRETAEFLGIAAEK
jgi:LDH2 family malate/lactate/ureidoglycolate dehydrogenase